MTVTQVQTLASGVSGCVQAQVAFSEEWDGYAASAVFCTGEEAPVYEQVLVSGVCTVPHEVLAAPGTLYIGVRGVGPAGQVRASTLTGVRVVPGAKAGDSATREPTPDVYQQILQQLEAVPDTAKIQAVVAAYLLENPAAQGPKGDKGDKGDPGVMPVRGTDYWTDADKAEMKAYVDEAILGGAW